MERALDLSVWRPGFQLWLGEHLILVQSAIIIYKDITRVYVPTNYAREGWGTETSVILISPRCPSFLSMGV